jgi:hypothetical protein
MLFMHSGQEFNNSFEMVLVNALKVPGVKVNRKEFLTQALSEYTTSEQLSAVWEKGPVEAGISIDLVNKIAKSHIEKRTLQSTAVSFAAGLPGGLAMAATIPADTLQFFGVALRMAQELAYLFGHKDLWENDMVDNERVRGELTLFLGVMFGVGGSASALKVLSARVSKEILKKLPQKALTKTIYYPIVKKIAAAIGIKITKRTFAQGISKAIPLLGGVISGGLTYASMKPMGNRLRDTLFESANNYTTEDFDKDFQEVKKEVIDIVDAEFVELNNEMPSVGNEREVNKPFSVADELLKFKQLLDMGVLTQEEFDLKKTELLNINNK